MVISEYGSANVGVSAVQLSMEYRTPFQLFFRGCAEEGKDAWTMDTVLYLDSIDPKN